MCSTIVLAVKLLQLHFGSAIIEVQLSQCNVQLLERLYWSIEACMNLPQTSQFLERLMWPSGVGGVKISTSCSCWPFNSKAIS